MQFQHLKRFNLQEIKEITGDFDRNKVIGKGGSGMVYAGVLPKGQIAVAVKRVTREDQDGCVPEFSAEKSILSRCKHDNIISLVGFCDEYGHKFIVYEHAFYGSLDCHLGSSALTWTMRLELCIGAAKALSYLHAPDETQQIVIHGDIKSANILLDKNWNPKLSDLGLSKLAPANPRPPLFVTNVYGSLFYMDPMCNETGIIKESDVYSFGVVLFEVLCGRLCYTKNHHLSLVPLWKKSFIEDKLDEHIFRDLRQGMYVRSREIFSKIAYQCLRNSRTERLDMSIVVELLKVALGISNIEEFKEMIKSIVNKKELEMLLSTGIIIDGGNTWFSLNENGEHCQMISAECFHHSEILTTSLLPDNYVPYHGENKSRFEVRNRSSFCEFFNAYVTTRYLSPNITYNVNLVFKSVCKRQEYLGIRYQSNSDKNKLLSFVAHERGDGWLMVELYQFINDTSYDDLHIHFQFLNWAEVEGIEFVPVEKVQLENGDGDLRTDAYSEQNLPNDYEDINKRSKDIFRWTTNMELYSIFCKGFLINNGEEWFSLTKNGKICHMLSAKSVFETAHRLWKWKSLPESRFREVAFDPDLSTHLIFKSNILSPQTTYATYLVYKLQEHHCRFEHPVNCIHVSSSFSSRGHESWYIYLLSPEAPVTRQFYEKKGFPQKRKDGWMEVQVYEFQTETDRLSVDVEIVLGGLPKGLIVQGIKIKPIQIGLGMNQV